MPEPRDRRVRRGATLLVRRSLGTRVLVGRGKRAPAPAGVDVVNPARDPRTPKFATEYFELRKAKGITLEEAQKKVLEPLVFGAFLVRSGDCAGGVSGSEAATADVLRAGLQVVGLARGIKTLSSCFLMILEDRVYTYADCGVVPNPTAEQLVDIALAAAENHRKLVGESPRVALLSFSTKGSASHADVEQGQKASALLPKPPPNLTFHGELQPD